MKKAIFALMALGFVFTSSSFAEEKKAKKEPSAAWKALPKEAKDQIVAINKKIKAGELSDEEGKKQKQAIWKANKKK
ncbi:MAG: hypothetical protein MK132_15390 [Lentisphaerales bacterium]|nr:hypothetical protein [Lentisphaerales bacterium]